MTGMCYPSVLFRLDASASIGQGHLNRCFALANVLNKKGVSSVFVCRCQQIDVAMRLTGLRATLESVEWESSVADDAEQTVDLYSRYHCVLAVLDHYRVDEDYQRRLLQHDVTWLQFDWAANQPLWADWILNANPAVSEKTYRPLVRRPDTTLLLGPRYALLREAFTCPKPVLHSCGQVRQIFVSFGGGDDRGAILFCLKAVDEIPGTFGILVMTSSINPSLPEIRRWTEYAVHDTRLLVDDERVVENLARSDIALISGGTLCFETAAMGVPSLIIPISDNQRQNAVAWSKLGTAIHLGPLSGLERPLVVASLNRLIDDATLRQDMSKRASRLVDGKGACRVADRIFRGMVA